jgi:hypothetical protein
MTYPTYRLGGTQQATLTRLANALASHPTNELRDLISVALTANLPAQALADQLDISYNAIASWCNDPVMTPQRAQLLPKLVELSKAIATGVAMGVLPTDGNKIAPTLVLLQRAIALRNERDAALVRAAAAVSDFKSFAADHATIASYEPAA